MRFLDVSDPLEKREEKAEKGRKTPEKADFQEGRSETPQTPINLLHPHFQVQKKHAKKFGIKKFGAPKTPPSKFFM